MARRRRPKGVESIQFYSLFDLPFDKRRNFSLRYPLESNEASLQRLKDLGVFYFRDPLRSNAILIPQPNLPEVTKRGCVFDEPFTAYVYQATTEQKGNVVTVRERDVESITDPDHYDLRIRKQELYGDNLWWDKWAQAVKIRFFNPVIVRLA